MAGLTPCVICSTKKSSLLQFAGMGAVPAISLLTDRCARSKASFVVGFLSLMSFFSARSAAAKEGRRLLLCFGEQSHRWRSSWAAARWWYSGRGDGPAHEVAEDGRTDLTRTGSSVASRRQDPRSGTYVRASTDAASWIIRRRRP